MAQPQKVQTKTAQRKPKTGIGRTVPAPNPAANDFPGEQAPEFQSLAVAEFDGEPRVRDLDLAERLGFERPRKIRELIERNMAEITAMGICPAVGQNHGGGRGRPTKEFFLNEEQALVVAALSNTSQAREVRALLIRTFVAYRRGQIDPASLPAPDQEMIRRIDGISRMLSHKVTEIGKAIPALRAEFITTLLEHDPRAVAIGFKPALEVLKDHDVPQKGRRGFSQRVSNRLRRFSLANKHPMRESHETGRWLFHVDAISAWLEAEGAIMIRDHIDKVTGQTVLKLVRKTD